MRNFIGREEYLRYFEELWNKRTSRIVCLYGRRRVGKTALITTLAQGKRAFLFEALEGEGTPAQIRHFLNQLASYLDEPHLRDLHYKEWPPVFDLLTQKLLNEKTLILSFDELSWMAAGRTKLVSYIKYYWDRHWKHHPHMFLILCGSVASWMIKNVVRSKALYGRVSENILLDPLKPHEVAAFIGKKRGQKEALEYLLCFGGIPRYLEELDFQHSLQINIEKTCFYRSGFFFEEADKIFYNQFKETHVYRHIVKLLLAHPMNLQELADALKLPSGGGLKLYLDNLRAAGIVENIQQLKNFKTLKKGKYVVVDEFLRFHEEFIRPYHEEIKHADHPISFEKVTQQRWYGFLGNAFERFCLKHRYLIADHLGFSKKVIGCGGMWDRKKNGFQFDLAYVRNDGVVSLCEMKYLSSPPTPHVIREFEQKLQRCALPHDLTIEKILICNQPSGGPLRESDYFHHSLHIDDLLRTG